MTRPALIPWSGFWMGGFEGADPVDAAGRPLDMAWASGHLGRLAEDHRRAAQAGLHGVRESVGWRLAESADGTIDLARTLRIADSARRHRLQVLWTLMHYGVPDGLSLHDDALIPRFARFAATVARALRERCGPAQVYTPVHEIGFTAWAAAQSGHFAPPNGLPPGHEGSSLVCGYAVKRRLARAALAAVDAIRTVDPQARFLHVEPLVHVVAPAGAPQHAAEAEVVRSWQWQAWDLLCGRLEPELGGRPDVLDLLGISHSPSSQWELLSERRLDWQRRDPRWRPFAELLGEAWQRYGRPLLVAGTGHAGLERAAWLNDLAAQVRQARARGVPVHGVCLYPLLDRPAAHAPGHWQRSGLWHVAAPGGVRVIEHGYRAALARWQRELPRRQPPARRNGHLVVLTARRWDSVPPAEQPVLLALARCRHVVVVEPPRFDAPVARLDVRTVDPQLDVLVPHLAGSAARPGHWLEPLCALLQEELAAQGLAEAPVWAPTRSGHRLARALAGPAACTLPPPPVGIDLARYRQAARHGVSGWAEDEVRALHGAIGHPRIGCVDSGTGEVLDAALLVELADTLPAVQVVLAGDAFGHLAPLQVRRPNLHLLSAPPPALRPALLAAWDAVLRPLRVPGSGAGLLEALASRRPVIVSGPPELAQAERLGVQRAEGAVALAAAVRTALLEDSAGARQRRRRSATFLRERDATQLAARLERALRACLR